MLELYPREPKGKAKVCLAFHQEMELLGPENNVILILSHKKHSNLNL